MIGDGMRVRHGFKTLTGVAVLGAMLGTAVVTTSPGVAGAASVPGLSPTSVTVGTISTQTGTLASNFSSLIYGERAYFNYVNNTLGGVNGRKINYQYALDDAGNPTTFNQDVYKRQGPSRPERAARSGSRGRSRPGSTGARPPTVARHLGPATCSVRRRGTASRL